MLNEDQKYTIGLSCYLISGLVYRQPSIDEYKAITFDLEVAQQ